LAVVRRGFLLLRCRRRAGDAEVGQEAAVVGLDPLLRQPAVVVVPERGDDFPLDLLAGGPDRTAGSVGEDTREAARERAPCSQVGAVGDDLLAHDPKIAEGGAKRGEVAAELLEAQVTGWAVEAVVLREVRAERLVVLACDRRVADAEQIRGHRTVGDEPLHVDPFIARQAVML